MDLADLRTVRQVEWGNGVGKAVVMVMLLVVWAHRAGKANSTQDTKFVYEGGWCACRSMHLGGGCVPWNVAPCPAHKPAPFQL